MNLFSQHKKNNTEPAQHRSVKSGVGPAQHRAVRSTAGFTLIEALVAILIFTSALIIFGTILSRGLSSITNSRSELQAYLFAQEGIEAVHQIRGTNRNTGGVTWLDGLSQCMAPDVCKLSDIDQGIELLECSGGDCDPITLTSSEDFYVQQLGVGQETPFTRTISINQPIGISNEVTVTSKVFWADTSGRARETVLSSILQDW